MSQVSTSSRLNNTDFSKPPRKVGLKSGQSIGFGLRAALFFDAAVESLLIIWPVQQLSVMKFGVDVPAVIVEQRALPSHALARFSVLTRFRYAGKTFQTWAPCGEQLYDRVVTQSEKAFNATLATKTNVRLLPLFPSMNVEVIPDDGVAERILSANIVFALLFCIPASVLFWHVVFIPWLERRILSNGDFAKGNVVGEKITRTQTYRRTGGQFCFGYIVTYQYRPRDKSRQSDKLLTGTISVSPVDYLQYADGDAVTVFYDPRFPKLSYAYEPSKYLFV